MACSHITSCELFVQFALNPALDIWKDSYCEGDYKTCVRFERSKSGQQIPLTLLPNGTIIKEGVNESICGSIAIFNAIQKRRTKMVASLLRVGVDIESRNINGKTPLMMAAEFGQIDIVRLLLENGADVHAETPYGDTAQLIAEKMGFPDIAKILSEHTSTGMRKTGT